MQAMNEIGTCAFAVFQPPLAMPKFPLNDFVSILKNGSEMITSIFELLQPARLPELQKLIFLLQFGMQVNDIPSN